MLDFLAKILSFLAGLISRKDENLGEKAGKAEQEAVSAEKTIAQIEAEQNAAAQHYSADDELRKHDI